MTVGGQEIWIAAALLYTLDSIVRRPTTVLLRYSWEGTSARLAEPTLTIFGRPIYIPNPLRPDVCEFPLANRGRKRKLSSEDQYFIRRGLFLYLPHQIVAVMSLLLIFVLTPFLAQHMDLLHACLITVLVTFAVCTFHWEAMWRHRALLGIDGRALRNDVLHVLFCPPYAVNSARRIAALRTLRYDAASTLRTFSRHEGTKYLETFNREPAE